MVWISDYSGREICALFSNSWERMGLYSISNGETNKKNLINGPVR